MKKGAKKTGQRTKSGRASADSRYKSLSNMFGEGLRPLAEEFCHQMQMVGTAGAEKPVPSRCLSAGKPISGNNELFLESTYQTIPVCARLRGVDFDKNTLWFFRQCRFVSAGVYHLEQWASFTFIPRKHFK